MACPWFAYGFAYGLSMVCLWLRSAYVLSKPCTKCMIVSNTFFHVVSFSLAMLHILVDLVSAGKGHCVNKAKLLGIWNGQQGIGNREYINTNRIYKFITTLINHIFNIIRSNYIWIYSPQMPLMFFPRNILQKFDMYFS